MAKPIEIEIDCSRNEGLFFAPLPAELRAGVSI